MTITSDISEKHIDPSKASTDRNEIDESINSTIIEYGLIIALEKRIISGSSLQ